jgi:N utilization substance protein A
MKTEFMVAITQLAALVSAYKKNIFSPTQDIVVKISPSTGDVKAYVRKKVVEQVTDPLLEITLKDARKYDKNARIDDVVSIEDTPPNSGRIAAQTARQVILQRLHEAEHDTIFKEFTFRVNDIITGSIQRLAPDAIYVDVGKAEAILPLKEQVHNERYRIGRRLKFYLLDVQKRPKGPEIILSRAHRDLLKRLFELEIPEIASGAVELKAVAREPGYRSKIAVAARQEGIDPIGCCVGLRGIRIQNIINEFNGEKIDVIQWSDDQKAFIANALSPAQVASVELNEAEGVATVVVPDKQLSLAIGKEGQNARLAAKLTGWRIDIKSLSSVEAEKALLPPEEEEVVAEQEVVGQKDNEEAVAAVPAELNLEPEEEMPSDEEEEAEEVIEEEQGDFELVLTSGTPSPLITPSGPQIRFAEDILPSRGKKKKGGKKDIDGRSKGKKSKSKHTYVEEEDAS